MHIRTIRRSFVVPAPIQDVYDFFIRTENLERISPPGFRLRVLSGTAGRLGFGKSLILSLRFSGIPVRWELEITDCQPPLRFVDRQRKGPFLFWEHEHVFSQEDEGTRVADVLRFAVPGFILEPFVYYVFVRGRLRRQFAFREQKVLKIFCPSSVS
jgi:ligand-binding SRPBCC domain-containing protein